MSILVKNGNMFRWMVPAIGAAGGKTIVPLSRPNLFFLGSSEAFRFSSLSEFLTIQKNVYINDIDIRIVDHRIGPSFWESMKGITSDLSIIKPEGITSEGRLSGLRKALLELNDEAINRLVIFTHASHLTNSSAPVNITDFRNFTGNKVQEIVLVIDEASVFLKMMDFEKEFTKQNTTANLLFMAIRAWKMLGIHVILSFSGANKEDLPKLIYDNIDGRLISRINMYDKDYLESLGLKFFQHDPFFFDIGEGMYVDDLMYFDTHFSKNFNYLNQYKHKCYCQSLEIFRFGCKCGGI